MRSGQCLLFAFILYLLTGCNNSLGTAPHLKQGIKNSAVEEDTVKVLGLIHRAMPIEKTFPDSAMLLLKKAITISKSINYTNGIVLGLKGVGVTYFNKGDYAQSITAYKSAIPYYDTNDNRLTSIYSSIGNMYRYQGDYNEAINCYYRALKKIENVPDQQDQYAKTCISIAAIFDDINENKKGLQYLQKAIAIFTAKKNYRSLALALNNKGCILLKEDTDAAISIFKKTLALSLQCNDTDMQNYVLNNLADAYDKKGMPQKAAQYLQQAAKIRSVVTPYFRALSLSTLGENYYQLKNYKLSEHYLNEALKMTKKANTPRAEMEVRSHLSLLYGKTGDYHKAWLNETAYSQLNDSLLNDEKTQKLNQLEVKYQIAQKDGELAEKQLKINLQESYLRRKNIWIGSISAGALLIIMLTLGMYRSNRYKQHLQSEKIKVLEQEQEINLLKASMNGEEHERIRIGQELHDGIGGLLSTVKLQFGALRLRHKEIGEAADFKKAIELLDEATVDVRKTAHNLMPDILYRSGISEAVSNFCQRIDTDQSPKIQLQIYGVIPRMNATFELSIYRIIQELINNILKHAEATEVLLQLNWQKKNFHIAIEDNGVGMIAGNIPNMPGIGIKNILSRVATMGGTMEIESNLDTGTAIYIEFNTDKIKREIQTLQQNKKA